MLGLGRVPLVRSGEDLGWNEALLSGVLVLRGRPSRAAHSGPTRRRPDHPGLGGGAWPLCSQRNHEPLPPQVQEPIGAGSAIPLPAGDWVAVARYEEGRKGLDPSKSERSGIGALYR